MSEVNPWRLQILNNIDVGNMMVFEPAEENGMRITTTSRTGFEVSTVIYPGALETTEMDIVPGILNQHRAKLGRHA